MSNDNAETMRVGLGTYSPPTDELLQLVRQLGISDLMLIAHEYEGVESALPLGETWTVDVLSDYCRRIESAGLSLAGLETMPIPIYDILLDTGDYDDQINVITETIRNAGAVDIPVMGYSGHPPGGAVRTTREKPVRGGALATGFDIDDFEPSSLPMDGGQSRDELWDRYEQFLTDVLPVAENAGVTMALHPSDPPVGELGGIPLLFSSFESFDRALSIVSTDHHQLKFCLGCWSAMGADLSRALRHFGGENIAYVHFRDVVGTVPEFHETFLDDESSNYDPVEIVRVLEEVGFTGIVTPDHVPHMAGERDWEFGGVLGRSFTVGYLKGLIRTIGGGA